MAEISNHPQILPAPDSLRWVDRYIGVPHVKGGLDRDGWDCWGCVRHVLAHHAGIALPADPILLDRGSWMKVEGPSRAFDLAEMRLVTDHVGIFVAPDRVLHCEEATGTVCVPQARLRVRPRAVWRHVSLS